MAPQTQNDGNSGCGCVLLIIIVLAIGSAAYLAIVQNAEFIGAKTIRTFAGEAQETFEYAKRKYAEVIDNQGVNPPIPIIAAPAPTRSASERAVSRPTSLPDTATERREVPNPAMRQLELKRLLLQLTNEHRAAAGVPPVRMGNNPAAQLHVEAALEGCYSSHWDRWGLKPNHRYTLTGGTGADAENGSGSNFCITRSDNYRPIRSMEQEVQETVRGWMSSAGHRKALLNPAHTELNIGIAYDAYNTAMAQHFTSDYVQYSQRPTIDGQGILTLSAKVAAATLSIGNTANIQIAYDPPLRTLTRGQLSSTYALCNPMLVATVVEPLPPRWSYNEPTVRHKTVENPCVDPYSVPADRAAPRSHDEAHQHWAEAKAASERSPAIQVQMTRIEAQSMTRTDTTVQLRADLSRLLDQYGPGIYTVILWGRPDHMDKPVPLSKQSIFWNTQPPPDAPY